MPYEKHKSGSSMALKTPCDVENFVPGIAVREQVISAVVSDFISGGNRSVKAVWIQAEGGFGKTSIVQRVIPSLVKGGFSILIQEGFYPQPDASVKRVYRRILHTLLPKDRGLWRGVIEDNPGLNSINDPDFVLSCICDILGVEAAPSKAYHLLKEGSKSKAQARVVGDVLKAALLLGRVFMALEDLHWLNKDDLQGISFILGLCKSEPNLFVMLTSRKDIPLSSSEKTAVKKYVLSALSLQQSLDFVSAIYPSLSLDISKKICHLSEGNPLFIKEYADFVMGELSGGVSTAEVVNVLDAHTPKAVSKVLYSRLYHCHDHAIEIARIGAVLGMKIDVKAIAAIGGYTEISILSCIEDLMRAKVIKLKKCTLSHEYEFSHERIQDSIYNNTPLPERQELHRQAIRYYRFQEKSHHELKYRLIMHHALRMGGLVPAYQWTKWAAKEAKAVSQYKSAIDFIRLALGMLKQLPSQCYERQYLSLKLQELDCSFILGRYGDVGEILQFLLKMSQAMPRLWLYRVHSFKSLYFWINNELDQAQEACSDILAWGIERDCREVILRECMRLSNICVDSGRYDDAIEYANRIISLLEVGDLYKKYGLLGEIGPAVYSCYSLACALSGRYVQAADSFDTAKSLLSNSQDFFTRIYVSVFLAHSLIVQGRYNDARVLLEPTLVYCDLVEAYLLKPYALCVYGYALAKSGNVRAGERYCMNGVGIAENSGLSLRLYLFKAWYAEILISAQKYKEALSMIERVMDESETIYGVTRDSLLSMMATCEKALYVQSLKRKKKRPCETAYSQRLAAVDRPFSVDDEDTAKAKIKKAG